MSIPKKFVILSFFRRQMSDRSRSFRDLDIYVTTTALSWERRNTGEILGAKTWVGHRRDGLPRHKYL
jgi:hypothetical protein